MIDRRGPTALLALEDGSIFRGRGFGASGEAFGEIVFNTAMSGYQEVLTDPSYARQVVVMTAPHQGNYGMNAEDPESGGVQVAGFVVREAARTAWSWRAERTLGEALEVAGVVGIEGVDTRRLTLRIRDGGAMRCGVSTEDLQPASLVARVREQAGMAGADLARAVSARDAFPASDLVGPTKPVGGRLFRVAAVDLGMKRNILRLLAAEGCDATVFPAETPGTEIARGGFDGVFLSNGPGDPSATTYGIRLAGGLLGAVPVFGICLGHQLLAHALGGSTYKMKFGHRGANQPVVNLARGVVEITSHNHGFAVDARAWRPEPGATPASADFGPTSVATPFGRVALTHWNLNDGTLEGLRCLDIPAFSVQYHPEAAPGPHDSRYLFEEFRRLMAGAD
jgi:carbamoyl-phosphate synthase small subunit